MMPLKSRITRLEQAHGLSDPESHRLPIFIYPHGLSEEALEAWCTAQVRRACPPGCQTAHVPVFLPEKEDTP